MIFVAFIMLLLINHNVIIEDVDAELRVTGIYTLCFVQDIAILFTGATYFPHLVTRMILFYTWIGYAVIHRSAKDDVMNAV